MGVTKPKLPTERDGTSPKNSDDDGDDQTSFKATVLPALLTMPTPAGPASFEESHLVGRVNRALTYLAEVKRFLRQLCVDEKITTSVRFQAAAIIDECLAVIEKLLTEGVPREGKDEQEEEEEEEERDNSGEEVEPGSVAAPVEEGQVERLNEPNPERPASATPCLDATSSTNSSSITSKTPADREPQKRIKIRPISNAVKPFTCTYCSQSFTQRKYLQHHVACRHEGVVNECPVCQKHFSSVNNLNIHVATHQQKREEFKCPLCDKVNSSLSQVFACSLTYRPWSIHVYDDGEESLVTAYCFISYFF